MKAVAAAFCTGLAAWCSLGTIGLMGADFAGARVALLPPWWLLPLLVTGVFAAIRFARLSPNQISPLFGSGVVLLPWLPFPVPAAALLWTGLFVVAIWVAVFAGVVLARWGEVRSPWLTGVSRAPIVAAAIALALYGASAWWLAPILPDGDSPHYLILAQSLIKDGDVQIENNHRRGDYLEYSLLAAEPHYLRRGVNGAIYSIHAPGLPAIIAPAMRLFGYPGAIAFLGFVAALSTALVWRLSYHLTGSASAAWFGWACCALTVPFFFQATQVFPDGFAATCLLLGTLPLTLGEHRIGRSGVAQTVKSAKGRTEQDVSGRHEMALWLLSGVSLALLPWLQTRLVILAAAAAFCLCFHMRSVRQFLIFAVVPIATAAAWFTFFYVVYGTPDPRAPYGPYTQTTAANLWRSFPGLLFDEQFGLIANAPVYGFVLASLVVGAAKLRRWSWELLAVIVPYTIGVGTYQIWWGGTSAPVRLLAPIALIVAVAGARMWHEARTSAARAVYFLALAVSVLIAATLVAVDHGRLLFNFRDGVALWVEWSNDVLDLPRGLPSVFRDDLAETILKGAIWAASILAGWLALRALSRRASDSPGATETPFLSWPAIWCVAAASMIAFTLVWRAGGVQPLTPATSEVGLLRHASAWRPLAYDFRARRFEPSRDVLSRARVRSDSNRRRVNPAPLLAARDVPAGTYQVHVGSSEAAEGVLKLRVGDTSLPFWTASVAGVQQHPSELPIRLPLDARSLVIEGDNAAVRSISLVELEPIPWAGSSAPAVSGRSVHRAVHYASSQTFFLDENAYPEPTGFWVAGGRTARTVIEGAGHELELFLRNAPVKNTVTIDVDGERHEIALDPGEERAVTLPRARPGPYASISITSRSGFRPSQVEPGNLDLRYLGCWVESR